jgi:hypothetical protein
MRLAKVLEGHEGLEEANANLMGQVTLAWDDERTKREQLLDAMARGGFREVALVLVPEFLWITGRLRQERLGRVARHE